MIRKKNMPLVALALLAAAILVLGASQMLGQQIPSGEVVLSSGAGSGTAERPADPAAPNLPAAAGDVAFSDSFGGAKLAGWRDVPGSEAKWILKDGSLQQRGDPWGDISNDRAVLVAGDVSFGNGIFEAQVYPTSGEPVGVVFRGSDAGYYRLTLLPNMPGGESKAWFEKVTSGGVERIASSTSWAGFDYSRWQRIEVKADGSQFTVLVDGVKLFEVADTSFGSGWIGVWTIADMGAQFDNVRVQRAVASR